MLHLLIAVFLFAGFAQPVCAAQSNDSKAEELLAVYRTFDQARRLDLDPRSQARLAAGAIESGRSAGELLSLFDEVGLLLGGLAPPTERAMLAAGAALSGQPPRALVKLFEEIRSGQAGVSAFGAGEMAAAAAISGKSADDLIALFDQFRALPKARSDDDDVLAVLAAGAARSGMAPLKLKAKSSFVQYADFAFIRAYLAAGAAISGLPLKAHLDLYSAVCASDELSPMDTSCSVVVNAGLIAAARKMTVTPDFSRQLANPVQPAKIGDGESAEAIFQLNWLGL